MQILSFPDDGSGLKKALVCCILVLMLGLGLIGGWKYLISYIVEQMMPISDPNAKIFDFWRDTDAGTFDLSRTFYFYNLTNPYDVMDHHEPPNFELLGPFVYREHLYNPVDSISWTVNNSLAYKYHMDLHFMPEKSIDPKTGQRLDPNKTKFTMFNLGLAAVAYRLSFLPNISVFGFPVKQEACIKIKGKIGPTVSETGIFTQRSVTEFMFGYTDPIWEQLSKDGTAIQYRMPVKLHASPNHTVPSPSPWSFRYGQMCPTWDDVSACNSSANQFSGIFSGTEWDSPWSLSHNKDDYMYGGAHRVGQMNKWNGQDKLWWWGEGRCQLLRGSNAMFYPQGITKHDHTYVFYDQLYRQVIFEYEKDVSVHDIPGLRFRIAKSELDTGPNNACYDQGIYGLFNLTRPMFAPMYISQPHFFYVKENSSYPGHPERSLLNLTMHRMSITEWKAQQAEADDTTYIDILPVSGTFMRGNAAVQANLLMDALNIFGCDDVFPMMQPKNVTKRDGTVVANSHFPRTLYPYYFGYRYGIIGPHEVREIRHLYIYPVRAGLAVGIAFVCFSVIAIVYFALRKRASSKSPKSPTSPTSPLRQSMEELPSAQRYSTLNTEPSDASSTGNGRARESA